MTDPNPEPTPPEPDQPDQPDVPDEGDTNNDIDVDVTVNNGETPEDDDEVEGEPV